MKRRPLSALGSRSKALLFSACFAVLAATWGCVGSAPADAESDAAGGASAGGSVDGVGGQAESGSSAATGGASEAGGSSGGTSTGGSNVGSSDSGGTSSGGTASGGSDGSGGTSAGGSPASGGSGAGGSSGTPTLCTSAAKAVTIYTIGDSTMSVYGSDAYPRTGWGQLLGEHFAPACAKVVDKALSGRSSKSFYDEGAWTPVKNALESGDYVLIQFGHNDEKSDDPTRYTVPQTTYKQYLTKYITEARAKQATPILLTSINRNNWSGTTLKDTHGGYPPAVRELAEDLDVPLIDHEALTRAYFQRIGPTETAKLFLILAAGQWPNYPSGVTDNTHLQEKGARAIGQLAMADAYEQNLPLASLFKAVPVAP